MNILLTGSTGFIGSHVLQQLQQAGYNVLALSRANGVNFSDMLEAEKWLPYLVDIDAVINCVGIIAETRKQRFEIIHDLAPSALFQACEQAGVKRVIQISALGAERVSTPYQRSKNNADSVLRSLDLDWVILKPSLVYGEGGKSAAFFRFMALLPIIPLIDAGKQQVQPVHVSDVAAAVLASLTLHPVKCETPVVGSQQIAFVDWLQMIRQQQGKGRGYTISAPFSIVKIMSHMGKYFLPIFHPDNLDMLQQGNTDDVTEITGLLGRKPQALDAGE